MRRALTLIAGAGLIAATLAADVDVTKTQSEGITFEKDQEYDRTNTQTESEDFNKGISSQESESLNKSRGFEVEKDFKKENDDYESTEKKKSHNKNKGKNMRRVGENNLRVKAGEDKVVEKSQDSDESNSKEIRHENTEEEEHTHHRKNNKDENTKSKRRMKKKTYIKGINSNESCGEDEKFSLRKEAGKEKGLKGVSETDFGQKYASNDDESFTKVHKRGKEVDVDVKGRETYEANNSRSRSLNKSKHEDEKRTREISVDKEKKVSANKKRTTTYKKD